MGKGGIIGKPNEPTAEVASGMWSLREHYNAVKNSIWPITAIDTYFQYVTMLLQGNGTNGAQNNTFLDGSTNNFTITRNGNTTQGSLNPFGDRWSNYFPSVAATCLKYGSNSALALGSGDFTVEFWTYVNAIAPSYSIFLDWRTNGNAPANIPILGDNSNNGKLSFVATAGGALIVESSSTIPLRSWTHIALVRSGSTVTMYFNGTSVGSGTSSATFGIETLNVSNPQSSNYNPDAYISNVRIVKGTALYTSNFTPPTAPLTAISGTSLLTCQSNRFIDNSSNNFTITRNGDVSVQPFSPFAPSGEYSASANGGSGYFDGTGDYLNAADNAAFNLTSGDFTIETWVYWNGANGYATIVDKDGQYASTYSQYNVQLNGSGYISFGVGSGTATATFQNITSSALMPKNSWTHIAAVKNGTTLTLYQNGVSVASATQTIVMGTSNKTLFIGYQNGQPSTLYWDGYISNLRIVKGTALYTSNFTPPTAPLTAITNTSLLLNFTNAGIIDGAADNVLETVGNAQISTSVKKYGTGSLAFDGSGDQLLGTTNPALAFGAGDFTIEAWVYQTQRNTLSDITSCHNYGVAADWLWSINSSGQLFFQISSSGTGAQTSSSTVPLNTWTHVAVARQSGTVRQFINGSQSSSATYATSIGNTIRLSVGSATNLNASSTFYGYIDDLRITKGVARYTSNFTPPTTALPKQ